MMQFKYYSGGKYNDRKKSILLALVCSLLSVTLSASVDTVEIYSKSMFKGVNCVVITPEAYTQKDSRLPVVYLLHGARGNFSNWVTRVPDLQELADINKVMIVCPDGNPTSWYFDSPVDSSIRYETFIARELTAFIDSSYRTLASREFRAITGLSMGGHGALFVAFRHPGIFGACGSMSGVFDVSLMPNGYGIDKVLGDRKTNSAYYKNWSVINLIDQVPKDSLAIIIDCGAQDFLSYMSRGVHQKMVKLNIPHDYIERPGKHDWTYWGKAIRYQLLFFREQFYRGVSDLK